MTMISAQSESLNKVSESLADVLASMEAAAGSNRGGKFVLDSKFRDGKDSVGNPEEKDMSEEEIQKQREKELEVLDAQINATAAKVEILEKETTNYQSSLRQLEAHIQALESKKKNWKRNFWYSRERWICCPMRRIILGSLEASAQKAHRD